MAKSSFELAIEKQRKEQKRLADKQSREVKQRATVEARINQANAIIGGQPLVGGLRILDKSSEEILEIILSKYEDNEGRTVRGDYMCFPESYHFSLALEFEKLKMYGVLSFASNYIDGSWQVTLSPQGLTYFADKEVAMKKESVAEQNKSTVSRKQYDVFISHANKDKSDYVDLLYLTMKRLGVNIFYDSEVLSWGDNWKQVILDGTNTSEFAIIVISENFFDREWTERELHEFLNRQNLNGQKIVLPLLHNISLDDLRNKYPELADIQVIESKNFSREEVAILFAKELIKRLK